MNFNPARNIMIACDVSSGIPFQVLICGAAMSLLNSTCSPTCPGPVMAYLSGDML